jgi:hypothetical protein
MTALSYAALEEYWIEAGGPAAVAPIAAAITYPESSATPSTVQQGQPYATTGWGLWQITPGDSVPSVGINSALLDPLTNAKAAVAKYTAAGDSFSPWTTFESGTYLKYVQTGVTPSLGGTNPTPDPSTSSDSGASTTDTINANIPSWQATILDSLSSQGLLSGVNPAVLAAIDQAESGGSGGTINSAGYGGFFGLAPNETYGASGASVTSAQLSDPGQASFTAQAETAASAFQSYLSQAGGNALRAETIYQQGGSSTGISGEGVSVFESLGLGAGSGLGGPASSTSTGSSGSGTGSGSSSGGNGNIALFTTPLGSVSVSGSTVVRFVLLLLGALLVYTGIREMFTDDSGSQVVVDGTKSAASDAKDGAKKGAEAGAAATAA